MNENSPRRTNPRGSQGLRRATSRTSAQFPEVAAVAPDRPETRLSYVRARCLSESFFEGGLLVLAVVLRS